MTDTIESTWYVRAIAATGQIIGTNSGGPHIELEHKNPGEVYVPVGRMPKLIDRYVNIETGEMSPTSEGV